MKEMERRLHDEKCDYQEPSNDLYSMVANDWTDAICCGCDKIRDCNKICAEFDAIIKNAIAKGNY